MPKKHAPSPSSTAVSSISRRRSRCRCPSTAPASGLVAGRSSPCPARRTGPGRPTRLACGTTISGARRIPASQRSRPPPSGRGRRPEPLPVGRLLQHQEAPALGEAGRRRPDRVLEQPVDHLGRHRPVRVVVAHHPPPPDDLGELHASGRRGRMPQVPRQVCPGLERRSGPGRTGTRPAGRSSARSPPTGGAARRCSVSPGEDLPPAELRVGPDPSRPRAVRRGEGHRGAAVGVADRRRRSAVSSIGVADPARAR